MSLPTPIELMIDAVTKERNEVYTKLKQYDRILKGLKSGDMSVLNTMGIKTGKTEQPNDLFNNFSDANNVENTEELPRLTFKGDTKIIIIKALDKIGKACKLSQIQEEYDRITGVPANIRESIRTLNKSKKILLMIEKGKSRGIFWVKREWVEDGVLLDEFKPYGFDSLYDAESLEYK